MDDDDDDDDDDRSIDRWIYELVYDERDSRP